MHILVAFLLAVGFVGGIVPRWSPPPDTVQVPAPTEGGRLLAAVRPLSELQNDRVVHQKHDFSCGSAALATLLRYAYQEDLSEEQVILGLMEHGDRARITERRAFSLLDMKRFVGALGYQGGGYKASIQDLETLDTPGIVPIELYGYRHFTVFRGMHGGHVFLADPWRGNTSYPAREFERMWYHQVVFLVQPPDAKPALGLRLSVDDLRYIDEDAALPLLHDLSAPPPSPGLDPLDELAGGAPRIR